VRLAPFRETYVPIDEEQPDVALEITDEAKQMLQGKLVRSGVLGVLSLIPGVGSAVIELMTELAMQRTNNRVKEMFDHFTSKIRDVGEQKVDREWFRSEEFQTLLYEAFSQLNVTHDREKIEMLGVALANSGSPRFKEEERKELFIRFVRDLTRQHLKVLLELAPSEVPIAASPLHPDLKPIDEKTTRSFWWTSRPTLRPKDDDLLALQMLHAYGLVEEKLKSSIEQPRFSSISDKGQAREALRQFIKNVENAKVERSFRLSPLGEAFLKFMGLPKIPTQDESA
jgi:hypothetical protein